MLYARWGIAFADEKGPYFFAASQYSTRARRSPSNYRLASRNPASRTAADTYAARILR